MHAEKEMTALNLRVDELTNTEFDLHRQMQEEQERGKEGEERRREGEEREVEMRVKYEQMCVAHDEINEAYLYNKGEEGRGRRRGGATLS